VRLRSHRCQNERATEKPCRGWNLSSHCLNFIAASRFGFAVGQSTYQSAVNGILTKQIETAADRAIILAGGRATDKILSLIEWGKFEAD